MPNFKSYNYDQSSMVVINYRDQLQPGTFEYAIHHLIEHKLDLSIFSPNYKNEKGGRKAYDPAILLRIILFAYSIITTFNNSFFEIDAKTKSSSNTSEVALDSESCD